MSISISKIAPVGMIARLIQACSILLAATAVAHSQTTEDNVTQFQDWAVQCVEVEDTQQCVMFQKLEMQDQSGLLLTIELTKREEGGASGIIVVPFGLDITKGMSLSIDDSDRWNVPFRTCQSYGCITVLTVDNEFVDLMKQSAKITVSLYILDGNRTLQIPVSLTGFTSAYNQL